jgi:hypothetical protein
MAQEQKQDSEAKNLGAPTLLEEKANKYVGNYIHIFLTALAISLMVAASIASVEMVVHGFPKLWSSGNEYQVLHQVLQDILLAAIAAELALLLLFHRASAAVEVVMFVIARRLVATDVTTIDLLVGSIALAILLVVRFYYLPGKPS